MRNSRVQFVSGQSMASTFNSNPINLTQMFGVAIEAAYTTAGTLGGTFSLQGSVSFQEDMQQNILNSGNWLQIAGSALTISGAGNYLWNVFQVSYPWVRLVYTAAGGDSGSLNAWAFTKGF